MCLLTERPGTRQPAAWPSGEVYARLEASLGERCGKATARMGSLPGAPEWLAPLIRSLVSNAFLDGLTLGLEIASREHGEIPEGAPWLISGRVTLAVSPLERFAQVHRVLRDLSRLEHLFDVRATYFNGGTLYVTFTTDYLDVRALAVHLEEGMGAYGVEVRFVERGCLELKLLSSAPATVEEPAKATVAAAAVSPPLAPQPVPA